MCRDRSVHIATELSRNGRTVDRIPVWERISAPSRPALESTQPAMQWAPCHSRGKAAGAWPNHPLPLTPRLEKV